MNKLKIPTHTLLVFSLLLISACVPGESNIPAGAEILPEREVATNTTSPTGSSPTEFEEIDVEPSSTPEPQSPQPAPSSTTLPVSDPLAPTEPQATNIPSYLAAAVNNLIRHFNLTEEVIEVESVQAVEWADASLGCPLPGESYAQVITPGYLITLEALDITYTYHTDTGDRVVLCSEDGTPLLQRIPIATDERTMDGEPWMPVD